MHTLTPQITAAQALAALQEEARRHQIDPTHPILEPIFQARAQMLRIQDRLSRIAGGK